MESTKETVEALYSYSAQHNDELGFEAGDVITVLSKDGAPWWKGELNGKVGLFPNNYVVLGDESDSSEFNAFSKESVRQQLIEELIATEQTYVEDLSIVDDVFELPIIQSGLLTNEQLRTLFNNWHEILECNSSFLRAIHVRRDMSKGGIITMIGDVLCENLPNMQIYVGFCGGQRRSEALLQILFEKYKKFRSLLKKCQSDPRTKGLPLSSFLIKPMQRITKYPLLINKILDDTPEEHPDRKHLEEASQKAEDLCNQVNELVREKENTERLEWLQEHILSDDLSEPILFNSLTHDVGPRRFLHYSALTKSKSGKELMGFLLNDFLLLAQPTRPLAGQFSFERHQYVSFRIYKQPLFLTHLIIVGSIGDPGEAEFQLEYNKIIFNLCATSSNEKYLWLKKLMQAKNILKECEKHNLTRKLSVTKKRPIGMLKLVVVYGQDLEHLSFHTENYEVFCEVTVRSQECSSFSVSTPSVINPTWQTSMSFLIKDLEEDIIYLTVKSKAVFSPDKFLGCAELPISDVLSEIRTQGHGPITKIMKLQKVCSGEVSLVLDVHIFKYAQSSCAS